MKSKKTNIVFETTIKQVLTPEAYLNWLKLRGSDPKYLNEEESILVKTVLRIKYSIKRGVKKSPL